MRFLFCFFLILLSACQTNEVQLKTRAEALTAAFALENRFLELRAHCLHLEKSESVTTAKAKAYFAKEKLAILDEINTQEASFAATEKKLNDDLRLFVIACELDKKAPFDLIGYLERHRFVSWNTFTVPVERRKKVIMEFREGWQFTDGKKGQYEIKALDDVTLFRERPLSNGGFGRDQIVYNIYKNRFEKKGGLFMWPVKMLID